MKYSPLGKDLYIENRKRFHQHLKSNSLAVFNSNDQMPTNADGIMPFRQNNDLLYFSGIDQEQSILILYPDFHDPEKREILFLKETSEQIAIWEGHKLTKDQAREMSGINTIFWIDQFENVFNTLMAEVEHVYLNTNEHIRAVVEVETRDARFIKWCQHKYPIHKYERSAPIVHRLRAIKSEKEIEAMQTACNITENGFRRILNFIKPGVWEYEIEAELMHEFLRNRSRGFAYEPIIASGFNACVLHYVQNNQQCRDGDVILLDVGAEYGNYNSDLTRSVPVNRRYSDRQKQVYNAVLKVQREAMELLKPGNVIPEYQKEVEKIMEGQLLDLGLIDKTSIKNQDPERPAFKKYFMHGTSHHLGLDVHDVGNIYQKMQPGMVFTVEPGIYIREENLGIRIENNVVITEDGLNDLMKNVPVEAEEIEELMNT